MNRLLLGSILLGGVTLVACGVSGGPSLLHSGLNSPSASLNRTVAQPAQVPCDPAGSPFGGGDGLSASTAFAICTVAHFQQIGPAGTAHFVLAADIDLSSSGYTRQSFSGTLDGNRHIISHLTLSGTGQQVMFTTIPAGSTVKDLGFTGVNISSIIGASNDAGATLAWTNSGTISGCFAKGSIAGTGGTNRLGGLVTNNNGLITNSYTVVTLTDNTNNSYLGGIASDQSAGTITDSYSVPTFGLAVSTTVGGLTATGAGNSDNSYWDSSISGTSSTAGSGTAVSKTTAEMKMSSLYSNSNWNSSVWYIEQGSYPKFVWEP